MASSIKTYFLSPSWDIDPKEVELGSVITNVRSPQKPINNTSLRDYIDTPIQTQEAPVTNTIARSTEWTGGLFATFLRSAILGGDVSYSRNSCSEVEYACEAMETIRFRPSPLYLEKVASDGNVQSYLKDNGLNIKIFVITGLKIAKSITITTSNEIQSNTALAVGLEIPAAQVNIGPKVKFQKKNGSTQRTHIESHIVFAFQVLKARIGRKGALETKDYIHGAMLGTSSTEDYVVIPDGDALDTDELDDYGLVRSLGHDQETGNGCEIIHQV